MIDVETDILEFLASTNQPIPRLTTYTDGWDIEFSVAPVEQSRILPTATARGLEDELGLKDYQDMLEWEQTHKKRASVVKGLQALIGGDE